MMLTLRCRVYEETGRRGERLDLAPRRSFLGSFHWNMLIGLRRGIAASMATAWMRGDIVRQDQLASGSARSRALR
jgi:hypothetical protein